MPYRRLPGGLALQCLESLSTRMHALVPEAKTGRRGRPVPRQQEQGVAGALGCVAALVSTEDYMAAVGLALEERPGSAGDGDQAPSPGKSAAAASSAAASATAAALCTGLLDLAIGVAAAGAGVPADVLSECFSSLRAFVESMPRLLGPRAADLVAALRPHVLQGLPEDTRPAQGALRVMGALLQRLPVQDPALAAQAVSDIALPALQSPSDAVVAAALGSLSGLEAGWAGLEPAVRSRVLQAALSLGGPATRVPASVRAAACKVLGSLAKPLAAGADMALLAPMADAFRSAAGEEQQSVRMAAAWALANLTDALRAAPAAAAAPLVPGLADSALRLAQDNEKVRAHAVRAVGHLLALCRSGVSDGCGWADGALGLLLAALETGSVKTQWNACYAIGALLRGPDPRQPQRMADHLPGYIRRLLVLVRSSEYLKIR